MLRPILYISFELMAAEKEFAQPLQLILIVTRSDKTHHRTLVPWILFCRLESQCDHNLNAQGAFAKVSDGGFCQIGSHIVDFNYDDGVKISHYSDNYSAKMRCSFTL